MRLRWWRRRSALQYDPDLWRVQPSMTEADASTASDRMDIKPYPKHLTSDDL